MYLQMPNNLSTTVGSTLQEDEFRRIVDDRRQECLDQLTINTTVPAGELIFLFIFYSTTASVCFSYI